MISKRLRFLFLLSLLLVAAHGVEEVSTGFLYRDSFIKYFADLGSREEVFYWTFHIMWWFLLIVSFLFTLSSKWALRLLTLFGVVFIFEIHHVIKGIITWNYYPGMITGFFYPILGIFYWRQVLKDWRGNR